MAFKDLSQWKPPKKSSKGVIQDIHKVGTALINPKNPVQTVLGFGINGLAGAAGLCILKTSFAAAPWLKIILGASFFGLKSLATKLAVLACSVGAAPLMPYVLVGAGIALVLSAGVLTFRLLQD